MNWRRLGRATGWLAAALLLPAAATASFRGFTSDGETIRPPDADGTTTSIPKISAVPLNDQSIKVDGKLDEPIWLTAPTGGGFKVWDPDRGAPPPEETFFKVAYDQDAVYFAVACLEKDASNIEAKLSRLQLQGQSARRPGRLVHLRRRRAGR